MKSTILAVLVTISALPFASASGLSKKYKTWDKSPEAYFLTNAERTQWKQVKTDGDAQSFILDYKAKRGPDFDKMLADREAIADKYFSSGETKGSDTLRGKVVIVFGPPSSIEKGKGESGDKTDPVRVEGAMGGGRGAGPEISSAGTAGPMSPHANTAQTPMFTFVYNKESAPKPIGKPFRVELKMYSAAEQEPEDARDFDAKVEAMAEASIVTAEPASGKQP